MGAYITSLCAACSCGHHRVFTWPSSRVICGHRTCPVAAQHTTTGSPRCASFAPPSSALATLLISAPPRLHLARHRPVVQQPCHLKWPRDPLMRHCRHFLWQCRPLQLSRCSLEQPARHVGEPTWALAHVRNGQHSTFFFFNCHKISVINFKHWSMPPFFGKYYYFVSKIRW